MIKKAFAGNTAVHHLEFDLINRILTVTHSLSDEQEIHRVLTGIGLLEEPNRQQLPVATENILFGLSGVLALTAELLDWFGASQLLVAATALIAVLLSGSGTLRKGWLACRQWQLNINLLMSVAVIGALAIGQFPEAAMVIFLFALAEKIEAASLGKARNAIAALQEHAPDTALARQADGSWREQPCAEIAVGTLLRVRPGERIALDGVVCAGQSSVNQAPVTGESLPVAKAVGDLVYAGTLNQDGGLEYRATSSAGSTTLDRIAAAIQQAQQQRAPTETMIERFAKIYTPTVFAGAVLLALLPPLLWHASWIHSIYQALVMLVIACPCALVISTPVTVVSALTSAARRGILIKGGRYLEQARHLRSIAFDKTGTLTVGKPALRDVVAFDRVDAASALHIAASLNSLSQHPLAGAMLDAAQGQPMLTVSGFQALPGRGVRGDIAGCSYLLGNPACVQEAGVTLSPAVTEQLTTLGQRGCTLVLLAQFDGTRSTVLALFSFADLLRSDSRAAVEQLQSMQIRCVMLTGDNRSSALAIAGQAHIDQVHAELLPEDKLQAITALQQHGPVAMVGDGVNDAPALARADIGITLGAAASATALETADVALMQNDLRKIPELISLSADCARVLRQNITLAIGIKVVFVGLNLAGHANLWMAVFADMGASLLVIFNGLRLLRRGADSHHEFPQH